MATWQNLIIQLGISALVLFVVYRLALKIIGAAREADKERTAQLRESDKERNAVIAAGFQADTAAHQSIVVVLQGMMTNFGRIEGKLDAALDLTPRPQQVPIMPELAQPSVIVAMHDEETTPVDRPKPTTPTRGVSVGGLYGLGKTARPKTSG
jgi:hypothetical protein